MKIGVFDSGAGGLSVANAIAATLPEHQIIFKNDLAHLPYGDKPLTLVASYVTPILQQLVSEGCQVIVIACNTVTTNLIDELRAGCPVPLVAVEPMVRPAAALTRSGQIIVCATPNTLRSRRYQQLKQQYAGDIVVHEPDCSDWSTLIEAKQYDRLKLSERLEPLLGQGADTIVLACTHYHWIEQDIILLTAGRASVLQPEAALTRQLQRVIAGLN